MPRRNLQTTGNRCVVRHVTAVDCEAVSSRGLPMSEDELRRFDELTARATALGWELTLDHTWRYVLRRFDQEIPNVYTASAARLDPVNPNDPLSGLDSVCHMLDQIEVAQQRADPKVAWR